MKWTSGAKSSNIHPLLTVIVEEKGNPIPLRHHVSTNQHGVHVVTNKLNWKKIGCLYHTTVRLNYVDIVELPSKLVPSGENVSRPSIL